ncbi:sodium-dependent glucose transporter 1A-like [Dendronephthya gigantea]|uniref:sodium-dependent glucose transporter 1A-like n=1 Tax=Dendronephthya gigantea TaxID=151771 RepID=UPI0010697702|nr:sodium-dependent glucose transporter 1A-like [Dendronephthya gigantea]
MHKVAKYKRQKKSSEVLPEILRSDESEDDLVEFINNSFPINGPAGANNSKKRNKGNVRSNDEESSLQEIDLSGGNAQTSSTGSNVYDLSSNGDSIILGDKPRSARSRLCIAFGLFVSFFALGIAVAMLGPSLLDLKDQVDTSFQSMSWIFTFRSIGYLLGSVIAGWLIDKWNCYLVLAGSCFIASICLVIIPLTRSFFVLIITVVCQGLALGSLDTGGNVLILNLYGKNSDAQMQGLHAMFGLGAFISPLLVGPFLTTAASAVSPQQNMTNLTSPNITLYPNFTQGKNDSDYLKSNSQDINGSLQYPYIISMLFFVMPIITFVGAAFRDNGRSQQGRAQAREQAPTSDLRAYRGFTLVLLFLFLLLYVGLEVAIGGLIFSYSYAHGILKSKRLAAYLTSTFWGSFCAGRFLSIPLSLYVRAYRILIMDLVGCTIGASILVFLARFVHVWLWVGASLLGLSMAAVFPSTMTWAESFMHISGRTASVLVVGASFGEMTIPLVVGTLMNHKGADVFVEAIFVIIVLTIIVFIVTSVLARRQKQEQVNDFGIHYRRSTEQSNHNIFSKGDEIVQLLEDSSEIFSVEN